jgi:hypothetical protein
VIDIFHDLQLLAARQQHDMLPLILRNGKLPVGFAPFEGDACPQNCGIFSPSRMTNSSS